MTNKTPRNTRKATSQATQKIYVRPSNSIELTQAQLDNYLYGDGLFIYGPDGATVAFISAVPDETDTGVNLVNTPSDIHRLDKLAEARTKLHLLEMLVIRDGHLELNENAVMGLATMLAEVQQAMVVG